MSNGASDAHVCTSTCTRTTERRSISLKIPLASLNWTRRDSLSQYCDRRRRGQEEIYCHNIVIEDGEVRRIIWIQESVILL